MSKVGLACLTGLGIGTAAIAAAVLTLAPEAIYAAVVSAFSTWYCNTSHRNQLGIVAHLGRHRVGVQEEI